VSEFRSRANLGYRPGWCRIGSNSLTALYVVDLAGKSGNVPNFPSISNVLFRLHGKAS
jgi:hypothetical protein